jgi:hypothetical protein
LLPAWAVDEFVDHWPSACGRGHVFAGSELVADGDPARRQVGGAAADPCGRDRASLPARALPRLRAPSARRAACRRRGQRVGPRYHAAVAVLSVRNRISRRDVVELRE